MAIAEVIDEALEEAAYDISSNLLKELSPFSTIFPKSEWEIIVDKAAVVMNIVSRLVFDYGLIGECHIYVAQVAKGVSQISFQWVELGIFLSAALCDLAVIKPSRSDMFAREIMIEAFSAIDHEYFDVFNKSVRMELDLIEFMNIPNYANNSS